MTANSMQMEGNTAPVLLVLLLLFYDDDNDLHIKSIFIELIGNLVQGWTEWMVDFKETEIQEGNSAPNVLLGLFYRHLSMIIYKDCWDGSGTPAELKFNSPFPYRERRRQHPQIIDKLTVFVFLFVFACVCGCVWVCGLFWFWFLNDILA